MVVLRIVPNLPTRDPAALAAFYRDLFELDIVMDHGWIVTVAASTKMAPQLGLAREGGAGTPVPDISIEVDDVDRVHAQVVGRGYEIVHPLTSEAWGVRRFFVRDPDGHIVNVLSHAG